MRPDECRNVWASIRCVGAALGVVVPTALVIVGGGRCDPNAGQLQKFEAENAYMADSVTMMCDSSYRRVQAFTAASAINNLALATSFVARVETVVRNKLRDGHEVVLVGLSYGASVSGAVAERLKDHPLSAYLHVRAVCPLRIATDTGDVDIISYVGIDDNLSQKWAKVRADVVTLERLRYDRNSPTGVRMFEADEDKRVVWTPNFQYVPSETHDRHNHIGLFFEIVNNVERAVKGGHIYAVHSGPDNRGGTEQKYFWTAQELAVMDDRMRLAKTVDGKRALLTHVVGDADSVEAIMRSSSFLAQLEWMTNAFADDEDIKRAVCEFGILEPRFTEALRASIDKLPMIVRGIISETYGASLGDVDALVDKVIDDKFRMVATRSGTSRIKAMVRVRLRTVLLAELEEEAAVQNSGAPKTP